MKNLSLNAKIWCVIALLAASYLVTTGVGLSQLVTVRDRLNEVTGPITKSDNLTAEIESQQRLLSIYTLQSLVMTKEEELKENMAGYRKIGDTLRAKLDELDAIASPKEKEAIREYRATFEEFSKTWDRVNALSSTNKAEAVALFLEARPRLVGALNKKLEQMNAITRAELRAASDDANSIVSHALWLSSLVAFFSILACLGIAWFVLRSLNRAIAAVIGTLNDSSTQVSSAAAQIAAASQQLSSASTEQAAALEETAASVEELNAMVAKNSENANASASTASSSQTRAQDGKRVVAKMTNSMDEISRSNAAIMQQINASNQSMAEIVKVIEQIDKKTKVINEIVNKTELLSFNASVEAARAGEHGKGFAVVADEVGNLARLSGAAADEIGTLLEQSIAKVNQTVAETRTGVQKLIDEGKRLVEGGVDVAQSCGSAFDEMVENVGTLSAKASEIASASQEQSHGCAEISKAMSQLDQTTQQNASTSEECASAAQELSAQAESLRGAVEDLMVTVNGGAARSVARPMPAPRARNVVPMKRAVAPTPARFAKVAGEEDGFQDV